MEASQPLKVSARRRTKSSAAAGQAKATVAAAKSYPIAKAFAVLETMAAVRRPLGASEIGSLIGLSKPTAYRVIRMLEDEGLIEHEPESRRYLPGARLIQLGLGVIATSMASAPRHAILEDLSKKLGETCNFGIMAKGHVVYLDRVEAAWPFGLRFEPGSRVPLHCTSMGKLFLSQLESEKRAQMLQSLTLYRYTENTITSVRRFEAELRKISAKEVSVDDQEFLAGVVCVAVPVRDTEGRPVAALAVSAPLARMSLARALSCVPHLQAAARRLSATFGQVALVSQKEGAVS